MGQKELVKEMAETCPEDEKGRKEERMERKVSRIGMLLNTKEQVGEREK